MPALITLRHQTIGTETIQTVNARELHTFLAVKQRFNDWISKRIEQYEFQEDRDFTRYCDSSSDNPNPPIDYFVSINMAKELSMVERTAKGKEARLYFLECERKLTMQASAPTPLPPTYHEQLDKLRAYFDFAESLNLLEDRDRLMLKDMARTLLPLHIGLGVDAGQPKQLAEPGGFFLSDRVRALGYTPSRKQEAMLMSKGLARAVAKEYRERHGGKPLQSSRFVDGAVRPVFWYPDDNADWIDPLIQTWCVRVGMTT